MKKFILFLLLLAFQFSFAFQKEEGQLLLQAAGSGDLDRIDSLLTAGTPVNYHGKYGLSAVHYAKLKGREEVLRILSDANAGMDEPMPPLSEYLKSLYSASVDQKAPGSSIIVKQGSDVIFNKAYGYSILDKKSKLKPNTKFKIGSITKQFTAAAILKLQEEGKIDTDDVLSKYIADFPRGNEVTIHHLLTHTSGIHSFTSDIDWNSTEILEPIKRSKMIDMIKGYEYDFSPGEEYAYNNSGYYILGYLIEKISGVSYAQYLEDQLLKPANMLNTGYFVNAKPPADMALGYSAFGNGYNPATDWDLSWADAAGALYSTTADLVKWNENLYSGKIISEESLKRMLTPATLNDGSTVSQNYGYGIMTGSFRGLRFYSHSGGLPGFNCVLSYYPDLELSVAVFTNSLPLPPYMDPGKTSNKIVEYLFWNQMESQKSFRESELKITGNINDYEGRFAYPGGMVGEFTAKDGKLYARLTGQPASQLLPQGNDKFAWKNVEAKIQFIRGDDGSVKEAVHYQNGAELKVSLIEEESTVELLKEQLEMYTGTYTMPNGIDFMVTLKDNQLMAKLGPQEAYPIFPKGDHTFFYKVVVAELTFEVEGKKASSVTLLQAGREILMPRK